MKNKIINNNSFSNWLDEINNNQINIDNKQQEILEKFYQLSLEIESYLNKLSNKIKLLIAKPKSPRGIYLYGDVGRGKSMLAQFFFNKINSDKKKYYHFHKFMLEIHDKLQEQRKEIKQNKNDYLTNIAKSIAKQYLILYIDELQVTDITDAMIVGKLFRELFKQGIVVITTSNRKPDDLYKNGLQRESFLEFIDLIKTNLEVINLNSETDYRLEKITSLNKTYYFPIDSKTNLFIDNIIKSLIGNNQLVQKEISINNRKLSCLRTYKDIAVFTFDELCKQPLGSQDYIELCQKFNIIIIISIPVLQKEDRNEAKRFVTLIDTMYENKTKLICTAAAEPQSLYKSGHGSFEFERTVSRLIEMQSHEYLER